MPCTINPSEDSKYIILTISGDFNRSLAMQYNIEAHRIGKELGIHKYLVDVTASRNMESVFDNYGFAYNDMQHTPDIDRGARVATLVSPDDHSHDFIETVARNAGLDVTIFRDREQAVRYLLQD